MSDGGAVTLRDLNQPESAERSGQWISSGPGWAEFELTDGGAPIPGGTPVGLQTSQTIYLGHVENGETRGDRHRLRMHVDHLLALQDVWSVQQIWSQEPSD